MWGEGILNFKVDDQLTIQFECRKTDNIYPFFSNTLILYSNPNFVAKTSIPESQKSQFPCKTTKAFELDKVIYVLYNIDDQDFQLVAFPSALDLIDFPKKNSTEEAIQLKLIQLESLILLEEFEVCDTFCSCSRWLLWLRVYEILWKTDEEFPLDEGTSRRRFLSWRRILPTKNPKKPRRPGKATQ